MNEPRVSKMPETTNVYDDDGKLIGVEGYLPDHVKPSRFVVLWGYTFLPSLIGLVITGGMEFSGNEGLISSLIHLLCLVNVLVIWVVAFRPSFKWWPKK